MAAKEFSLTVSVEAGQHSFTIFFVFNPFLQDKISGAKKKRKKEKVNCRILNACKSWVQMFLRSLRNILEIVSLTRNNLLELCLMEGHIHLQLSPGTST